MKIGLKRGTVELVPYQHNWKRIAQTTISLLSVLLGDIAIGIEHVGSTSIQGVCAKPIIDIAVGVKDLDDILPCVKLLEQNGIIFRGTDVSNQYLFIVGDLDNNLITHHIHIVEFRSSAWNNYINFRDYLNSNPDKALDYVLLKRKLATEFPNNREAYTRGKQEFIETILKLYCKEGG